MSFGSALLILLLSALIMGLSIIMLKLDAHIPLIFCIIVTSIIAILNGFEWEDIYTGIKSGIMDAVEPTIILALVGLIIGTWMLAGTVPTIIYYGLKLLSPGFFLVITTVVCALISTMTGTAWGTAGTVGIAFMGIGIGLGFPPGVIAGAVLSGAYFGDKMSPMSDTTILASGIAKADIWDHIHSMFYTTIPGVVLALGYFTFRGLTHESTGSVAEINSLLDGLSSQFNINPLLILPAIFVIVLALRKTPALPTLLGSSILAGIMAFIFQKGITIPKVMNAMHYGYVSNSGDEMLDQLLSKGGLNSMMWSISLILIALTFGGILQKTNVMETLIQKILRFINTDGKLIAANLFSCFLGDALMGTQYMGIIIPGKMYQGEFEKRKIAPYTQSRLLEDAGTLLDCLIPWTIGASFFSSTLGVSVFEYAPHVVMNWSVPIISLIYGFVGFAVFKDVDGKRMKGAIRSHYPTETILVSAEPKVEEVVNS